MVTADLLVFDMDGVLVDVSDSYRETIVRTVRHFTGRQISRELIQDYKNQGGWNNDWALSWRMIRDCGVELEYDAVVQQFNQLWMGAEGTGGLVERERWIPRSGLLETLQERYSLAIFTGRMHYEADITLGRFAGGIRFHPVVCAEDVATGKPAPDGLVAIRQANPDKGLLYFGDVVDDARSASAAGVPFVGIVAAHYPRRDEATRLLREEGAIAVLEDINQIQELLG